MVRKQVYIEQRQERVLKRLAEERGISEARLIREGIDGLLRGGTVRDLDRSAWEQERRFIARRERSSRVGTCRRWTRDELYER